MNLLYIENSKLVHLTNATRQDGEIYLPSAVASMVERYKFAAYPKNFSEMTNKSIDFYHGLFGGTAIAKLSIFPDGISIDAKSNSGLLDQFLDDLLQWSRSELGISTVQTYRFGRLYQSDIVFHSDKDILVPFEGVAQMQSMLNKKFLETSKVDINWRPVGWSLGYDPIDVGSVKPNPFHVARRVGTDYSLNHYFSTAPLRTSDHIELIEALERIV